MQKVFFIIGVNGVGKTTLMQLLNNHLDSHRYAVHDFDERGVPDNADGSWRISETLYWAEVGKENIEKGISTIICGYSKPKEINQAIEQLQVPISVCLLDANEEAITNRILNRYKTPESVAELLRTTGKEPQKFIQDNIWVAVKFREEATLAGYSIIDTSALFPEQVAGVVENLIGVA